MIDVDKRVTSAASLDRRLASPLNGTRLWASPYLSPDERQALAEAALPTRTVSTNHDLVREGEGADHLFFVIKGWACRYATTREGGRQLPALLVPGDVGNLDSLLFDRIDYGVRTLTQTVVVPLPRDRALALAVQHPGIARTFTWLGLLENAILSRWALSIGRRSALERLAHLLCELSVRVKAEKQNQSSFLLPLTQEQMADVLGLTAVHVNRMMHQLRLTCLLTTHNRVMTVPDIAQLRRAGDFNPRYLHLTTEEAA